MSTHCTHVDNFVSSPNDPTTAAYEAIAGARKTHKSLPNGREAVWPQFLEKALIRGLEIYRPSCKAGLRASELQRFPKRNKKISDYIFEVTRQRRTPKQVGSRLQQMKETVKDPWVQKLLTSKNYDDLDFPESSEGTPPPSSTCAPTRRNTQRSPSTRDCQTPVSQVSSLTASSAPATPPAHHSISSTPEISVQLDVSADAVNNSLLSQLHDTDVSVILDLDEQHLQPSCEYPLEAGPQRWASVQANTSPQIILNWSSLFPTASYRSTSVVYLNGEAIYSDADHAFLLQPYTTESFSPGRVATLFRTNLVPRFWSAITKNLNSPDAKYTIIQTITHVAANSSSSLASALFSSHTVCTITYNISSALSWSLACYSPPFSATYSPYSSVLPSPEYDSAAIDQGYLPHIVTPVSPLPSPSFGSQIIHDFPLTNPCHIPNTAYAQGISPPYALQY